MCLDINKRVRVRFDADGWCRAWKFLLARNRPPYFSNGFKYRVGVVKSDRLSKELSAYEAAQGVVFSGIHVYLDRPRKLEGVARKCVEVWCHRDDLVAVGKFGGKRSAVFTKVTVKSLECVLEARKKKKGVAK